jgi:hypothetical protein
MSSHSSVDEDSSLSDSDNVSITVTEVSEDLFNSEQGVTSQKT